MRGPPRAVPVGGGGGAGARRGPGWLLCGPARRAVFPASGWPARCAKHAAALPATRLRPAHAHRACRASGVRVPGGTRGTPPQADWSSALPVTRIGPLTPVEDGIVCLRHISCATKLQQLLRPAYSRNVAETVHDLNVVGAFALAVTDDLLDVAASESQAEGARSAAVVSLAQMPEGRSINSLATALRVSHSRA